MQPLLTLAIPTYNRAGKLNVLLEQLTTDPAYVPAWVEIVVSDNASTDHTEQVVAKFPTVRYHRNHENIGYGNFTVVLDLATGRYVRLMNDTARFNPGMLGVMLEQIAQTDSKRENLIFTNELIGFKQGVRAVGGKDGFVDTMSYLITWIGNFGMWAEDFRSIEDKDRMVKTLMQHVDWLLCMAGNGKQTKIVSQPFVWVDDTKKKGSYDIFDTFITKYLSILSFHRIGRKAFAVEKYRLFRYFVLDWYFLLKRDKEYTFDASGTGTIWKRYWYEPYFAPLMVLKFLKTR